MSEQIKDGGPAYPQTNDAWFVSDGNMPCPSGMSLRDYFAAAALASMTVAPDYSKGICNEAMAQRAYIIADAMIAARDKQ